MPPEDLDEILRFMKGLADQSRLRIVGLLASHERSVDELATLLDLRVPTVSHHLAKLRALDLVRMRVEGTTHLYRLDDRGLVRLSKLLATPQSVAAWAGDEVADSWERKVLRDFFADGRLKEIPAQQKKRRVILKWLADQFEWGRVYSEAEINDTIKRYHPDAATLRRALVGAALMDREEGRYWRIHPLDEERLREVADTFTWGQLYSQAEVDDILRRALPDHAAATVRHELLNARLLDTRQDTYWRAQPPLAATPEHPQETGAG
jgi:DNA-binding transcriptional ArsR family regulator